MPPFLSLHTSAAVGKHEHISVSILGGFVVAFNLLKALVILDQCINHIEGKQLDTNSFLREKGNRIHTLPSLVTAFSDCKCSAVRE